MPSEASPLITINRLLHPHLLVLQHCPILLKRHLLCKLQEMDHRLEYEKRAFPAKLVLPKFTGGYSRLHDSDCYFSPSKRKLLEALRIVTLSG